MAFLNSITTQGHLPLSKPSRETKPKFGISIKGLSGSSLNSYCRSPKTAKSCFSSGKRRNWSIGSFADELDVIPVQSSDSTGQQDGAVAFIDREQESDNVNSNKVGGFVNEGRFSFDGGVDGQFQGISSSLISLEAKEEEEEDAGHFAITKLLTIDRDYWHKISGQYDSPSDSVLEHAIKRLQNAVAVVLIFTHISYILPIANWNSWSVSPAKAVLYSPDTKVPRTGELALRKAIPANTNMKAIQNSLEDISYLLRIPQRKPYGTMEGDVKKALKIAVDEKASILGNIQADLKEKGSILYASLVEGKGGLQSLIESIKEKDPDKVSLNLASSLDYLAELELLQARGLSFLLPGQYLRYPRLTGRATVEFTIEKGDGSAFSTAAGGEPRKQATIQVVLDGYSAPLTAGNFAKLVIGGAYDGVKLKSTDQAVLPDKELENYGYSLPLEIMPSGQFEPLYKTTLSVQDGELPVLPLSVYGAVAMAHNPVSEEFSSPSQFFFYLYDKRNAGLGGLSFDEGQFSVFGYATRGREILSQIKTGDLIKSAKLVQGQDRLVLPLEG